MARTLIKITAAAPIGLIAIALLVYLWLRYEFARLEPDPANYEAPLSVTVDTSVASPSPSGLAILESMYSAVDPLARST